MKTIAGAIVILAGCTLSGLAVVAMALGEQIADAQRYASFGIIGGLIVAVTGFALLFMGLAEQSSK